MDQIKSSLATLKETELKDIKKYIKELLLHPNAKTFHVQGSKDLLAKTYPHRCGVEVHTGGWWSNEDFPREVTDSIETVWRLNLHPDSDDETSKLFADINIGKVSTEKFRIDFRKHKTMPENIIYWMRKI